MPTQIRKLILSKEELSKIVTSYLQDHGEIEPYETVEYDKVDFTIIDGASTIHFTIVEPPKIRSSAGIEIKSLIP